ncbi:hypothetical protein [Sphingobacterium sp. FBM7-1]|uniref:hypothetical protein n=1 Tax=Sphingobacterium sp. FBM7-1 TaxID=2886688 RepID=UPI001D10A281|nr:hypothetical protein [Sphingobacterium sp. FBM7-1]MCC2599667.1 hypothetical protein [Sphingobacterium sp. FBM7-1]
MKQIYQAIACCCFLLTQAIPTKAQSTDIVKFYVAYDQSGSIGIHDNTHNLQQMAERLLKINREDKKLTSPIIFEFFGFGGDASTTDSMRYNPFDAHSDNPSTQGFIDKTSGSRSQRYSHIHTALEAIQQAVRTDTNRSESVGVFIFTDGLLDDRDVNFGSGNIAEKSLTDKQANAPDPITDLAGYKNYLSRLIQSIQLRTKNNLYVIQASPTYTNNIPVLDSLRNRTALEHAYFATNSHLFWLQSKEGRIDSANISKAFDHFVQEATWSILSPSTPTKIQDTVEAALIIQQIYSLAKLGGYKPSENGMSAILSSGKQGGMDNASLKSTISRLERLYTLLQGKKVSTNDSIKEIKTLVGTLAISPDNAYLPEIQKNMEEKIITTIEESKNTFPVKSLSGIYMTQGFTAGDLTSLNTTVRKQMTQNMEQALILGFTDYVIDRAKQEAVYAFLENLNDQVFTDHNCENYPDNYLCFIKDVLFAHVGELMDDRQSFPDMATLKAAFQRDLQRLPNSLKHYFDHDQQHPVSEGIYTLLMFMDLFDRLMNTGDLERSFEYLSQQVSKYAFANAGTHDKINIRQGLLFTTQLIGYLQKYDLATIYEDNETIELLSKMFVAFAIDPTLVGRVKMEEAAKKVQKVYHSYRLGKQQVTNLQRLMATLPQSDYQGYRLYQKSLFNDVINHIAELLLVGNDILYDISLTQIPEGDDMSSYGYKLRIDQLTRSARKSVDAWFMLKEGAYVQAMLFIVPELKKMTKHSDVRLDTRTVDLAHDLMYIAGEVSVAQNSSDVKNIIANYAMPPASYRTKRIHSRSMMLTAYAGIGANIYLKGEQKGSTGAIIAPTGLEYTMSLGRGQSLSVMGSVIDIGNVINYRLLGTQEDQEDVVQFERILSPGLHVSYGSFGKLPLAFNAGYQWNPGRFSAGVFLDMPLLTFWKKERD